MLRASKGRKVELRFSATDVINKDIFSLSDPFLVCHTLRHGQPHQEIGRTETVQDDLNPVWATTFSFNYDPSLHHNTSLVVDLFDRDSRDSSALSKHDFLGRALFLLSDLLASPSLRLDLPLCPVTALLPATSTTSSMTESHDDEEREHDLDNGHGRGHHGHGQGHGQGHGNGNGQGYGHEHESQYHENEKEIEYDAYQQSHFQDDEPGIPTVAGVRQFDEEYDGSSSPPKLSLQYNIANTTSTAPLSSSQFDGPPSRGVRSAPSASVATAPRKRAATTAATPVTTKSTTSSSANDLKRATSGMRATKVKGTVSIFSEVLVPSSGVTIRLRVRSALLKDASQISHVFGGFRITQFYEVQRERTNSGDLGTWSCVYRSGDGVKVDKHNYVVFDDMMVDEGSLNNMQSDRKLRIAFYKRHTRSKHQLISYVTTTLAQLRKGTEAAADAKEEEQLNQANIAIDCDGIQLRKKTLTRRKFEKGVAIVDGSVALRMEGEYGDDDGLGSVLVKRLDGLQSPHTSTAYSRTDSSGQFSTAAASLGNLNVDEEGFSLRADHFLNKKFISSLNAAPTRHERRLLQKPAFMTLH